ncbi:MAG TPA: sulfotransferase domain-containing protein [Reyranella sp.]|nr:sulfotransferase domain-containing protein [Reyranella sp.]
MKYNLVVATHHKTGTVWMDGVFKAIAKSFGVRYVNFRAEQSRLSDLDHGRFILFCYDSQFREHAPLLDREDVKILHLVRDPRDVVISAMHYHKGSRESWLHEPIPGYDNATYQRALRRQPTRFLQYVFEMENSSASTLRDMMSWRYGRANCCEVRYEDLRQDSDLTYWQRITSSLGFSPDEQPMASRSFWQNSLFGGLPRLGNRHIRSGTVAQWKHEFTPELARAFLKRFPDVLQRLGYETSDAWVLQLPPGGMTVLSDLQRLATHHWEILAGFARSPLKF